MKNKKLSIFSIACLCAIALQSLASAAWANDLQSWQKGVIEGAFIFSPYLRSKDIRVEIQNNFAILKGYVDSETSKALAEQFALSVKGINKVVNRLIVAPEQWESSVQSVELQKDNQNRLSNVTITNKVRSQLLANRITSGIEIDVETRNQVVTLSGSVNSEAEKILMYWLVKNTQGVKQVVDKLEIVPESSQHAVVQLTEQLDHRE
ncbi:BON domain-containing protein [Saccharophagus sp. K07]|uniref:BON domain-containing protein n=1 Tax=Saccharophagus sp. K07 TaxID=2283636 RepID=UPI001651D58A|nr:BON domain-containing protein [Saccharophagus sp. K07]MBC6904186.1 BON domain-containing protein [Saccharophagus sp. K07]